jgi:multiple sugar transport system ATP-binding protein
MASVSLKKVVKRFGGHAVIPGIDLEIPDREFVVFLGPSGCGKSTLLRIIAGLEAVDEGDLFIGERRVNDVPAARRDIAMVFQDYALYPHMTVFENMAFGLEMRGTPREEIARRVNDAARMLRLEALLERKPRALSGGQRQRVAMGRAIVREPRVFLFDEPLSNLDALLRGRVRTEIKRLSLELRTTTIFVTHDQVEAMTLAERIVVLEAGEVQQVGTPEEIYNRPANLFVAGFIGAPAMNLFPATVPEDGSAAEAILADGTRVPLGAKRAAAIRRAGARQVQLGLRPENLVARDGAHPVGLRVRLDVVETLGSDTFGYFTLGGKQYVGRLKADFSVRPGVEIELGFEPGQAHVFSDADGRALR